MTMLLSTYVINPKTLNFGTIERKCFLIISKKKNQRNWGAYLILLEIYHQLKFNEFIS
jgi:hypothetical protein